MGSFKTNLRLTEKLCYANLVTGLVGIITGIVLLGVNSDYKDFGESYNIYKASYTLLILVGVFFAILGLLGICAQRKKRNCTMTIYNIGVIVLMIFIGCSLIVMIYTKVKLSQFKDDTNCSKQSLMKDLKATYDAGKSLLCSSRCPCDANPISFPAQVYSNFYFANNGVERLDECNNYTHKIDINFSYDYNNYNDYLRNLVNLLRTAEESFNCSGFCSTNSYYVFRNINDGTPSAGKDCKEEFLNFISKNIIIAIVITSILVVYMLIVTYLSLSTMLSDERKQNGGYYQEQNRIQVPNQNEQNNVENMNYIPNSNQNNLGNMNNNIYNNYNNNNNIYNTNQPTKNNNSVSYINRPYPNNYQYQQNITYVPGIAPPQNIEGLPVIQEIQLQNQEQKYPQLQQTNQGYINNMQTPHQENAKYAKY
ncbi:tetraspanin family protein (macronuclear) [Tetrahymena thermophila SB210]|uniref:Tetraspanin family protein n=1 Tax=Tetrahymena thermophila (strain SB210) TaxID=312017 RepID=Q22RT6_TETTS|nr:tetraspanin family protein [Tetrahymena thermophila SB210]EAR88036.1 tetraspanin family protein [Tetrahymena thermophila SB210]|eukprot:XP_001008281.1 tetraspanin family protein [Tetrahymena thermophila SB210]